jgi:hypothetical protein
LGEGGLQSGGLGSNNGERQAGGKRTIVIRRLAGLGYGRVVEGLRGRKKREVVRWCWKRRWSRVGLEWCRRAAAVSSDQAAWSCALQGSRERELVLGCGAAPPCFSLRMRHTLHQPQSPDRPALTITDKQLVAPRAPFVWVGWVLIEAIRKPKHSHHQPRFQLLVSQNRLLLMDLVE